LLLAALLAALPRRVRVVGVAAVLAVLVFGTVRAISSRWARPPFRAAAHYLDQVAAPRDPVVLYPSFLGLTTNISTHFHSPHVVVRSPNARWPQQLPGARAYVVTDDSIQSVLRIPVPQPRGFQLISRKHYAGLVNFTILGYQRTG
jgi:hypothetical protein